MTTHAIFTIEDKEQADILRIDLVKDADPASDFVKEAVRDMIDTSKAAGGMGLAAPQIGHMIRAFVMESKKEDVDPVVVINPKLVASKGKVMSYGEGCLSVPGKRFDLKRAKEVVVVGVDQNGKPIRIKSKNNLQAIVIQHEMDHLRGVLVCDKGVSPKE